MAPGFQCPNKGGRHRSVPKSKQTLLDEPIHFHFRNIPPKGSGSTTARGIAAVSRRPGPAQTLGPLSSLSCPATRPALCWTVMPSSPCLSGQAEPSSWGPLFGGHTAVPFAAPTGHLSTAVKGFPSGPVWKKGPERLLGASVYRAHDQPNNTQLFNSSNSFSSAPPPRLPLREN